jgi:hypothetical protein
VKNPQPLAGADVEAAHIAFHIGFAPRPSAREVRRADNNHAVRHGRRRCQADVGLHQIHGLIVIQFQVDDAMFAETGDGYAVFRIQRNQPVTRCHVVDALLPAIRPIRQAASGNRAWSVAPPFALIFAVHPQKLTGFGIERDRVAARSGGGVNPAMHH